MLTLSGSGTSPAARKSTTAFIALAVSLSATLPSLAGTPYAAGLNHGGQLGNGTFGYSNTSVTVNDLAGVARVAAGQYHSLAVKTDGTVWAWGFNADGELGNGTTTNSSTPVEVSGLTGVKAIGAGWTHCIALKNDGTVWTWGGNVDGQLGIGSTSGSTTPVQVSGLASVVAVAGGLWHSLALKSDGTVWAWGWNVGGQLGDGTTTQRNTPVEVVGAGGVGNLTGVAAISAGDYESDAIESDGTVRTWGDNYAGELGNGTTTDSYTPVEVVGKDGIGNLAGVVAVAATYSYTLALKSDGTVWAWGGNYVGQLGNNSNVDSSTPVQVSGLSGVGAIAVGYFTSLALKTDGTVWTWGIREDDQTGDGGFYSSSIPVELAGEEGVGNLSGVTGIAGGGEHSLALKSDSTVRSWGDNTFGQLGNGIFGCSATPSEVIGDDGFGSLTGVVAIAAGFFHSLARKSDGTVWTWGLNSSGQLGNGTNIDSSIPVQVSGLASVIDIAGGSYHTLAIKSDGAVWAWGSNYYGQLGNGATTNSSTPVQVSGLTSVVAVAGGGGHSLALKSDGTVWAWGSNYYGQLGNGATTNGSTPVQVSGLTSVVAIAGGTDHSLAVRSDGTVWAWGYNEYGQLGNGTTTDSSIPVQVSGLTGAVAVAGGEWHSLALTSDGAVWAWGENGHGQLGNSTLGSPLFSSLPLQVSRVSGVVAIATEVFHSVALESDGAVWAWGDDTFGQLGNGEITPRSSPARVVGVGGTGTLSSVTAIAAGYFHSLYLVSEPELSRVSVSPTTVTGGGTATGAVTLTKAVPSGSTVTVNLASSSAAVVVPASVVVNAGANKATFAITTRPVATNAQATITASYDGITESTVLGLVPPVLSALSVSPSSVTGGTNSKGTVTLNGFVAAGSSISVSLSSNNAAASVPAKVSVSAGTKTATFTITTTSGATSTAVTIGATEGGVTKSASLTVVSPALTSVSVNPTTITGGIHSTGTVLLTGPVAAGSSIVVNLSSNVAAAAVPATVVVAAGTKSATFTITTSPVPAKTAATIGAAYNGVSKSTALTVVPPVLSALSVGPSSVTGGVHSTGTVTLTGLVAAGSSVVVNLSSNKTAASVPATVTVAGGLKTATFTITTTPVGASTTVTLSANEGGVTRSAALLVMAPALNTVSAPLNVIGGTPATGTVTLSGLVAAGHTVTVTLSSNSAVAAVPGSVTVAAGAKTGTFTISTSVVASDTPVTISGTYVGVTQWVAITVKTAQLKAVSFNPTSVTGGSTSKLTVSLTGAAPAAGFVVKLTSDDSSAVPVPSSVTVPAGKFGATTTITTGTVSSVETVTVTATGGATSKSALITVNP